MLYSFENSINDLPNVIPLFPLNKVLLLPRARLPLNLFENRYLHMLDYALSNKKIIGMIQPKDKSTKDSDTKNPNLYQIGCAGRVTAFSETNDNRYELILKGVCRFKVIKEKKVINGFRSAEVKWDEFKNDFNTCSLKNQKKKEKILSHFLKYFLKKYQLMQIGKWWKQQMTRI